MVIEPEKTGGAAEYDIDTIKQAGIDPQSVIPKKRLKAALAGGSIIPCNLRDGIMKLLRVKDEQDAVNRYVHRGIPLDMSSQEVEWMLYYYGNLCFFYCEPLEKFLLLPYTLSEGLDLTARYEYVTPVPLALASADKKDEEKLRAYERQKAFLGTLRLQVLYDFPEEITYETLTNSAVILYDYTRQRSQEIIPRQQLQDPLLGLMSEVVPYCRTSLKNATGVMGMRVNSPDEAANVIGANLAKDSAALNGDGYVPVLGRMDFQGMDKGTVTTSDQYLQVLQALDNLRLGFLGLDNGGVFRKSSYQSVGETSMNQGNIGATLQDGLLWRQHALDIINYVWELGWTCEVNETAISLDTNMDGMIGYDKQGEEAQNSQNSSNIFEGEGGNDNV